MGNEAAFGDENADKYFLGSRGLSAGTVLDANLGQGAAVAGTVGGGVIGAAAGAGLGIGASKMATSALKDTRIPDINIPKKMPLIGGKSLALSKPGLHSPKIRGLGAIGAIAGAAIGGSAYLRGYTNRNKDFIQSNPYSKGSAMQASSTGAYGDIVLGMHNSRRG